MDTDPNKSAAYEHALVASGNLSHLARTLATIGAESIPFDESLLRQAIDFSEMRDALVLWLERHENWEAS